MQDIVFSDQSFRAYIAFPPSHSGPGVLVYHAWWGLTEFFTQLCDMLATEGFVALAPDLFHGETAHTIEEAKRLRAQVDRKKAKKEARTAIDYLASHSAVSTPTLGAVGFSYGCGSAIESARLRPKSVKTVVLFYGTGGGKLEKTQAVFQGHFAEHDEWGAAPEKAHALEKRITAARQTATFYIYPGTTHWFFEKNREAYNADAAQLAWQRTIRFLREHIVENE